MVQFVPALGVMGYVQIELPKPTPYRVWWFLTDQKSPHDHGNFGFQSIAHASKFIELVMKRRKVVRMFAHEIDAKTVSFVCEDGSQYIFCETP